MNRSLLQMYFIYGKNNETGGHFCKLNNFNGNKNLFRHFIYIVIYYTVPHPLNTNNGRIKRNRLKINIKGLKEANLLVKAYSILNILSNVQWLTKLPLGVL